MINEILSIDNYYFCYTADITNFQQNFQQPDITIPLWKTADTRFFWNMHLQQKLIELCSDQMINAVSRFILPVLCGFVHMSEHIYNESRFNYIIISRRSRHRAGARYHSRGIDIEGNVSNFVETEQIVTTPSGSTSSFVQTRGSIPLFWKQIVNIKYKPKLLIERRANSETMSAFSRHFENQIKIYSDQIVVNLINKNGYINILT